MGHVKAKNQQQNSAHLPPETAEVHTEKVSAETFLVVKLSGKTGRRLCVRQKGKTKSKHSLN